MPVTARKYWQASAPEFFYARRQYGNDLIASRHSECAAGQKIPLYIDDQQCIMIG
jgi:hypothetical protein